MKNKITKVQTFYNGTTYENTENLNGFLEAIKERLIDVTPIKDGEVISYVVKYYSI